MHFRQGTARSDHTRPETLTRPPQASWGSCCWPQVIFLWKCKKQLVLRPTCIPCYVTLSKEEENGNTPSPNTFLPSGCDPQHCQPGRTKPGPGIALGPCSHTQAPPAALLGEWNQYTLSTELNLTDFCFKSVLGITRVAQCCFGLLFFPLCQSRLPWQMCWNANRKAIFALISTWLKPSVLPPQGFVKFKKFHLI